MSTGVCVIGAGPAGLAAAVEAHRRGCRVTLIDEAAQPGGQIYRQGPRGRRAAPVTAVGEQHRKRETLDAFDAVRDHVDYRPATVAHALFPGPELHVSNAEDRAERLTPDAVVVATGVSERGIPFPGWTLPGVLYAGGIQSLLKGGGIRPGGRIVIAGAGPLTIAIAAQLVRTGAEVAAVAVLSPLSGMGRDPLALWAGREIVAEGFGYLRTLRRARVPLLDHHVPVRVEGRERVEALVIAACDGDGRQRPGTQRRIDNLDMVGASFGFTANSELVRMAGADVHHDAMRGGWLPVRDAYGETSIGGVFTAGDGAGLRGALVAAAEGRIVGAAAACHAHRIAPTGIRNELVESFRVRERHQRFQRAVCRTLALPDGVWSWATPDTLVCRCEGVTRARVEQAIDDGHQDLDAIKRNTRAGMGWCGGRTCLQAVGALCRRATGASSTRPMRARPVARPVSLAALASLREEERV